MARALYWGGGGGLITHEKHKRERYNVFATENRDVEIVQKYHNFGLCRVGEKTPKILFNCSRKMSRNYCSRLSF